MAKAVFLREAGLNAMSLHSFLPPHRILQSARMLRLVVSITCAVVITPSCCARISARKIAHVPKTIANASALACTHRWDGDPSAEICARVLSADEGPPSLHLRQSSSVCSAVSDVHPARYRTRFCPGVGRAGLDPRGLHRTQALPLDMPTGCGA